jgi:hypothetical protein
MDLPRPEPSTRYNEICTNIRTTDEISFRLLGLVPLISGAGIFGLSTDSKFASSPISVLISFFAAVVTFAIFIWERRNIQLCNWFIDCAKTMEKDEFNWKLGQYAGRPDRLTFSKLFRRTPKPDPTSVEPPPQASKSSIRLEISKTAAEYIIYLTTMSAWTILGIMILVHIAYR